MSHNKYDDTPIIVSIIGIVLAILIIVGGTFWKKAQWDECRKMGFSKMYCIQHIM